LRADEQPVAAPTVAAPVLDGSYAAALVMDADTGEVLMAKNPHLRRQPASMLKMMTELIILEGIAAGDMTMEEEVTVSAHASRMGGSQVYLKHGEVFTVRELLMALAIHSANDASMALAEHVAGSSEAFIDLMNMRAAELGMQDTEFHSVHGLPPAWKQKPDLTSAYDMALLGRELIHYPESLEWASTATAPFRDGEFIMYNPNHLVGKYRGLDGLKTGYHGQSGFCVTATAVQKGKRLISVVLGCPSDKARATETTRLLSYGFNMYTRMTLVEKKGQLLGTKLAVKGGKMRDVEIVYAEPLTVCVPKSRVGEVLLETRLPEKAPAPLEAGQVVGSGVAMLGDKVLGEVPIVTLEAVPKGSWLDRIFH
jgi:D-alanyl-D-alanine carboxypeptidase (penicillin-binding protein 5/6)